MFRDQHWLDTTKAADLTFDNLLMSTLKTDRFGMELINLSH